MTPEQLAKYGYKDMHQFRNWRWFKGLGGGPLSDLGAHQIDIFNWWFGITAPFGHGQRRRGLLHHPRMV